MRAGGRETEAMEIGREKALGENPGRQIRTPGQRAKREERRDRELGGKTSQSTRFRGFAVSHFVLSIFCLGGYWVLLHTEAVESIPLWWLICCISMAAYFCAGLMTARAEGWSPPESREEKALAIFYATAVAWIWAAFVLFSLFDFLPALVLVAVYGSFILATPSSLMVLLMVETLAETALGEWTMVCLVLAGLAAGIVPPTLFALGSFWGGEKKNALPQQ